MRTAGTSERTVRPVEELRVDRNSPVSLVLEQEGRDAEEDRALAELFQLLRATEPCHEALRLQFRRKGSSCAGSILEASETIDLDFGRPDSWGWWAREGERERILIHEALESGQVRVLDTLRVESWYRISEQKLDVTAAAALAEGLPSSPTVMEHDSSAGTSFQDTCLPPSIGIGFVLWSWTEMLESAHKLRVLGRSDWYGVDCLVVLHDASPRGETSLEYEGPQLVWFDDQSSGLALGMRAYRPFSEKLEDFHESDPGTLLRMSGRQYGLVSEVDVLDFEQMEDGCWIPTLARIFSLSRASEPPRWHERVIEISAPPDGPETEVDWFNLHLPAGTSVFSLNEAPRVVLEDGFTLATESEASYAGLLRTASSELELAAPALELVVGHPFELGSCGPAALLMLAHLEGIRLSYGDLLARLGSQGGEESAHSLASLGRAAGELRFAVRAIEASAADLRESGGAFLAWVEGGPFAESHFGVAVPIEQGVSFYSPPDARHEFGAPEFEGLYRGIALLPEERARRLVDTPDAEPASEAPLRSVLWGLATTCAVAALATALWKRGAPRPDSSR